MEVIATNIGQPTTVLKNGKKVQTGFYKNSVKEGIMLLKKGVVGDAVMDTKHHGGADKACYLYSADHYDFWKEKFPTLNWSWGMFGENLTIKGLQETEINIGDTFKIGTAIIQVTEPRRPCSILGIRFGTPNMIKLFNNSAYPGVYVRVIKEGKITTGNQLKLISKTKQLTVVEVFSLFSTHKKNTALAKKAIHHPNLAASCKKAIRLKFQL